MTEPLHAGGQPPRPPSTAGRLAALAVLFALAACGGGGGGDDGAPAPPTGGTPSPAPGPAPGPAPSPAPTPPPPVAQSQPLGLYWSWTEEDVPFTDPSSGLIYFFPQFRYVFRKFFDNGLVYVGDPGPDIGELECTERTVDDDGDLLCAPFEVSDGTIRIEGEDEALPLERSGDVWTIDDKPFTPIAAEGDVRLAGRYESTACYLASCTQATFEFKTDGTFEADEANTYANTIGGLFVGGGGGGESSGTYKIGDHGITLTLANGNSATLFFFREDQTIMIGEDWYDPEE